MKNQSPYRIHVDKDLYKKFMVYCILQGQSVSMKKMIEPFITDIVKDFNFPMESVKGFKWSKKAVIERLREKGYIKRGRRSMYSSRSNKNGVLSPIDSKHSAIIDLLMEGHSQRFISEELSVSRNMVRNVADHMNGKRRIVYVVFKTDKN